MDSKELFAWRCDFTTGNFQQPGFLYFSVWVFYLETLYESKCSWVFEHFFWSKTVAFD